MTEYARVVHRSVSVDAATAALDRIEADGRHGIWIEVFDRPEVMAAAASIDRRVADGDHLPLAGSTLAVKGNIDVAGHLTTAGCPSFGRLAESSAPAVVALEDAGAVVVGITNMDQFATGLVGTRSPYGVCPNAHWPPLVAGGSSSGSAVAVSSGLVDLALGTDTAGSGRVPAACNGIVGLKPTRGRFPGRGVVPACESLDCVSVFARTVVDAASAARLMAAASDDVADPWRRPSMDDVVRSGPIRVGVPEYSSLTFDGDPTGLDRFASAMAAAIEAWQFLPDGIVVTEVTAVDIVALVSTGALLYEGAFVAERFAAVGDFVASDPPQLDPIVREVIADAGRLTGADVFRDLSELQRRRRLTAPIWGRVDVLVVPSVPRIPTVAEVWAEPYAVNAMLGTYTNFVNLLDLAALTVPVGASQPAGPPASVTLVGPAWSDDTLVNLGALVPPGTRAIHRNP